MKALSIKQPWAWLIANGHKPVENRRWKTRFRGQFLVHAGKSWGAEQLQDCLWVRQNFPRIQLPERFDLGGVVGTARVIDCVRSLDSGWFHGPYGLVVCDAQTLPFTPWRGQLGWFEIPLRQPEIAHV
jgi:hypothetical protein